MLDRSLKIRSVVGIGAAVAAFAIAAPMAAADPAPLFIPHSQGAPPQSLRQTAPRLGEGLTGADRSWLPSTSTERHVASPSDPFNWGDAGIGAGTAAIAFLVASGGVVMIRRRVSLAH